MTDSASPVISAWLNRVDDLVYLPYEQAAWDELRARAAETGRGFERERLGIVMLSMWHALTPLQPLADEKGFGHYWVRALSERSLQAARYAEQAAGMAGTRALETAMFNAGCALENAADYGSADNSSDAESASRAAASDAGFASRAAFEVYRYPRRPGDSVLSTLRRLIDVQEG